MRVLILLPGLKRSGPVQGAVALAKYINSERCEITVGCLGKITAEYHTVHEDLRAHDIEIEPFDISGWLGLLRINRTRNTIRDFIISNKIDIINSYGIRPDIVNAMVTKNCI